MNQLNDYGVSERFLTEATLYPNYQLARVIAQHRGKYKIVTEQAERLAEISGKLRYATEELAQYPTVGDYVMVDMLPEFAVIHQVLTRKSLFIRKAVGLSGQAQPIAANVD
ncbi:MAG: ribosome small subunit-dependent GTPase, partial [Clostridiales bacterium]|nr:ribosome small subunit-dependent GTPase [Clostridiales bacterium]